MLVAEQKEGLAVWMSSFRKLHKCQSVKAPDSIFYVIKPGK